MKWPPLADNQKAVSPEKEGLEEYRCECGQRFLQTYSTGKITPERIEGMSCPQCGARYVLVRQGTERK